jgi:DNA-binding beta-propeller fold protein YncE
VTPRLGRALAAIAVIAGLCALALPASASAGTGGTALRDVLVVSNNWAGTADLVDPRTFDRLTRLNVIPDASQRVAEIRTDPTRLFYLNGIRELVGEGHNQYVDDGFVSRDGRYVYFSRPSFADVVAIDLKSRAIAWRVPLDGYRADHMALSRDGRRLLVSASTARVVDVIDTRTARIVGRIPAGDQPHENNYSRDGSLIFQASIGTVYTDTDDPSQAATKGERVFEVIDAKTLKVKRHIDMGKELAKYGITVSSAVRPMAISPDERYIYLQLSFLHGFVEYDLKGERPLRIAVLPIRGRARGLPRTEYLLDSAQHGLALNRQGTKFCVAGTMSDYAAVVSRETLRPLSIVDVGAGGVPYWSTTSRDGRYCFVSVARKDRVSVISFASGKEVARIPVGFHPQRMRTGRARADLL